ncbi:hypothetical protein JOC69_000080 [Heliobacterium gestii]|nr:hypothetical protein [Heliomicrobium gestii]
MSAIAPKMGCANPQKNCPTARAKLMETIPNPVALWRGETKSPTDCLAPIVIAKMVAEQIINSQTDRTAFSGIIVSLFVLITAISSMGGMLFFNLIC